MTNLAIVIPAYKEKYLKKTLDSIANQTNKNFCVYIGDDCSPYDLKSIVYLFEDKIDIHYTKFETNIGAKNLVLQWRRCIDLVGVEKWLWLFSDDDLMDDNCVENFYRIIERKEDAFDVYRFNTVTINVADEIIDEGMIGPEEESSEQMAYHLLKGKRGNSMPDHIFSKKVYLESGGFVFTSYAQAADWATSILFSQKKGISTIPDSKVYWRYSGQNISSLVQKQNDAVLGHMQFISWALKHFYYLRDTKSEISYQEMVNALKGNLTSILVYHYEGFHNKYTLQMIYFYHDMLGLSYLQAIKEIFIVQEKFNPFLGKVFGFYRKFIKR